MFQRYLLGFWGGGFLNLRSLVKSSCAKDLPFWGRKVGKVIFANCVLSRLVMQAILHMFCDLCPSGSPLPFRLCKDAKWNHGLCLQGYSPPQVDRIWLWVYYNKILIYRIFYLHKADYKGLGCITFLRKRLEDKGCDTVCLGGVLAQSTAESSFCIRLESVRGTRIGVLQDLEHTSSYRQSLCCNALTSNPKSLPSNDEPNNAPSKAYRHLS